MNLLKFHIFFQVGNTGITKNCAGKKPIEKAEAGKAILQKKADDLLEKTHNAEEKEAQVKKKEELADELIRNRQQ